MIPITQLFIALTLIAAALYLCFDPGGPSRLPRTVFRLFSNQHGFMVQRINRSGPEKIFIAVYNSYSTAALTNGQSVIWDFATDADGVGVTRPTARATNAGSAVAGVVAESSLAAGAYGLMQVYGYHSAVRMRTVSGGTPAIVAGRPLVINAAGSVFCCESVSTASKGIVIYPMGFSLGATSGWTTAAKPAFIKTLG